MTILLVVGLAIVTFIAIVIADHFMTRRIFRKGIDDLFVSDNDPYLIAKRISEAAARKEKSSKS